MPPRNRREDDGRGDMARSSGNFRVAGSAPSIASTLRKQREKPPLSDWARVGIGALAAAVGVFLLATVFRPLRPEEHPQYQEALRILRNDDLQPTDTNVRLVLQMIDTATKPYSDSGFHRIDASEWTPYCTAAGRICRSRPQAAEVRLGAAGENFTLLPIDVGPEAKVWFIEDLASPEEVTLLLQKASELNFTTSPTKHQDGQDWRSSSTAYAQDGDEVFDRLRRRAAMICGVSLSFVEPLQVVRYLPGERYSPHMDSEGPEHRHWTLLLYLDRPDGGGDTAFPMLQTKVAPWPGAAVMWENLRWEAEKIQVRNYFTLHAGLPPIGTKPKIAVNIWVRNSKYDLRYY